MNRATWTKACIRSKLYKPTELVKCNIAFDGATQGASVMDFDSFQLALDIAGNHKKMSGTDIGAYLTHSAMKIVEENAAKGIIRRAPTKESMKADIRKALAKSKEKVNYAPPPAQRKKKMIRRPPGSGSAGKEGDAEDKDDAEAVDGKEKEAKAEGEEKKEEGGDDDVPDIKAIAARNQYLESQAKLLADLNARLAEKKPLTDKEIKKDKTFSWDTKEKVTTRVLETPGYWDWG